MRQAVCVEGLSRREAARRFGIDPRTVPKMLAFSVPPGHRRSRPLARSKPDPFVGIIDRILEEDKGQPAKQQHTSKRIFKRLREEHGYSGGITIVVDYSARAPPGAARDVRAAATRPRVFSELQSHYLFADRFGRSGKGNDIPGTTDRRAPDQGGQSLMGKVAVFCQAATKTPQACRRSPSAANALRVFDSRNYDLIA